MQWELLLDTVLRLVLAMVIGGFIGWERAKAHHPAGIRTHMLVTIGAAIVMLLGSQTTDTFYKVTTSDPARLGAQVISGIGFLGAGTIIKEGKSIRGLTTAATLWVSACLGLAIGAGQYIISICGFMICVVALRTFKMPRFEISFMCSAEGDSFHNVCKVLDLNYANICNFSSKIIDEDNVMVHFELYLGIKQKKISTVEILNKISSMPSVRGIDINAI